MRTAEDLLLELHSVDESHRIEAKRATQIDRSILETVCALSNEPGLGGGYLLLGVAHDSSDLFNNKYVVDGISNPDKLQSDLASQCASALNRPVRPRIQPAPADSHLLLAQMPEALRARLPAPGSKPRKDVLRRLLQDLCSWRALSAREIGAILARRDHKELVREHLSPMVAEGALAYTVPEMENHPEQRYTAAARP